MRNYRPPRSTTTSGPPIGHGGVGQVIGAIVLAAVFLGSMALLSNSWETNLPLAGLGFVISGVVLGVVLTDKDLNRSVPGLTVVLLVFCRRSVPASGGSRVEPSRLGNGCVRASFH